MYDSSPDAIDQLPLHPTRAKLVPWYPIHGTYPLRDHAAGLQYKGMQCNEETTSMEELVAPSPESFVDRSDILWPDQRPHGVAWWLACMAIALLHTACSTPAQAPFLQATPNSTQQQAAAEGVAARDALQPGEYVTERGWGRLFLKEQEGSLTFSLESLNGEDTCGLDGTIQGNLGTANGDNGPSSCKVKLTRTPQGIEVAAATPEECEIFCGYNGDFAAPYLRVEDECGRDDLDRTRARFRRLYNGKNYKAALATLSPVLANCLPTLEWEEEGAIRNDLAIAQYKNGLPAECLVTLDKYAEDAGKDDEAVTDGWAPALADRYLAIVRAARTNIDLCRIGLMKKI